MNYLTNVLNLDSSLASSLLIYFRELSSSHKKKLKYLLKKVKSNKDLINLHRDELLSDPEYLDELFPFSDSIREKFDPLVLQTTQELSERQWVQNLLDKHMINVDEDLPKLRILLQELHKYSPEVSISKFKDDSDLFNYLKRFKRAQDFVLPSDGCTLLGTDMVDGNSVALYEVTRSGIEEFGKSTNWCVSHGYRYEPDVYYGFVINGKPEVLVHPSSNQIKDVSDRKLNNIFVKFINNLVNKFHFNTGKGDFSTYNETLSTINNLERHLGDKKFLTNYLSNYINNIVYLPISEVHNYLPLMVDKISVLNFYSCSLSILELLGNYINFHDLPERVYLDNYALEVLSEEEPNYLQNVPKSFRTKFLNDVYKTLPYVDDLDELFNKNEGILTAILQEFGHVPDLLHDWFEIRFNNGDYPSEWDDAVTARILSTGRPPACAEDFVLDKLLSNTAPIEWIDKIYDYVTNPHSSLVSGFATPWIKHQLNNGEAPKKVLDSIPRFIEENGELPSFATDYVRDKIHDDRIPRSWLDASYRLLNSGTPIYTDKLLEILFKKSLNYHPMSAKMLSDISGNISRNSFVPLYAKDWLIEHLNNNSLPIDFRNFLMSYLIERNYLPNIIQEWGRLVLDSVDVPFYLIDAISASIRKHTVPPTFCQQWLEECFSSNEVPISILSVISDIISATGRPPFFSVYWLKDRLLTDSVPSIVLEGLESYIRSSSKVPPFFQDWYVSHVK